MGLKDDPAALDRAAAIFWTVLAKAPDDIRAQVGLADALRKRAPLSGQALAQLSRARQLIEDRPESVPPYVGRYIAQNLVVLERRRSDFLNESVATHTTRGRAGLTTRGLVEIDLERGSEGFAVARQRVTALLKEEGSGSSAVVWLAELLRQEGRYEGARRLSRWVQAHPCRAVSTTDLDCNFAREEAMKLAEQCAEWERIEGDLATSPCAQPTTAAQAAKGGLLYDHTTMDGARHHRARGVRDDAAAGLGRVPCLSYGRSTLEYQRR